MYKLWPLLLVLVFAACDTTADADHTLTIDLLGAFDDTFVTVSVDGEPVFSGSVTTGSILATAGQIPVSVTPGTHRVRAVVEGQASATVTVSTDETEVVGVSYRPETNEVTLLPSAHPFPHR